MFFSEKFGAPFYVNFSQKSKVKQKENIEKMLKAFGGNSFVIYLL